MRDKKLDRHTTGTSSQRTIRMATVSDLEELVHLEEACFSAPWSRKSFEAELQGNQFSRIFVISNPMEPLGILLHAYICVWLIFEEIRFLNLAVHPQFRRRGLAKQLIQHALRLGIGGGCRRGMLEVRRSNQTAKALYETFNFKEYAIRNSYYTNPREDAILMKLEPICTPCE